MASAANRSFKTVAEIEAPDLLSFERGVAQLNMHLTDQRLQGKILQVVTELFNNILDHNDPKIGSVVVRQDDLGVVQVIAEGEANDGAVEKLENRIEVLTNRKPDTGSVDSMLRRRRAEQRHRGRGLYWIARGAKRSDGSTAIEFDRQSIAGQPGREHYRLVTTYDPRYASS